MKRLAWALGIFIVSVAMRAIEYPRVFTRLGVFPPNGADEYYHLRRIWYSVVNFPSVLEHDSYMAYPAGGEVMWPPGFDLAVAALARLLVGDESQHAVAAVAAWVPPILGGLAAVTAAAIAARSFSPLAGILSGFFLALLPGHYVYSLLGMVDHHCAVSLLGALLILGSLRVAQLEEGERWFATAVSLGLGAAAFLNVWPGALLQIGLVQALASVWMLQAPNTEIASQRARHLALAQGVAALALAPYALGREWLQFSSLSPLVLSQFQPLWLFANSMACLGLAMLWASTPPLGATAMRRWALALALAATAACWVVFGVPELTASLDLAAGWFRGDEEFLAGISEMLPLFAERNVGPAAPWWGQRAERMLTRFIFVYPIPLLWLAREASRTRRADLWLIVAWAAISYAQTLAQTRFINSFSVSYVVVLAGAAVTITSELRQRVRTRSRAVRATVSSASLIVAAVLVQPAAAFVFDLARIYEVGPLATVRSSYRDAMLYRGVARWIAANTPQTSGYLDASKTPEYAVLGRWDRGHLLRYESERPVVQDNFGPYAGRQQFDIAQKYFSGEGEAEAVRLLEQLGVRYIVADGAGAGRRERLSPRSMARRLYPYPASGSADAAKPLPLRLAGFRHHRLILETQRSRLNLRFLRVFERVAGASIEGYAEPHEVVTAELEVRSQSRAQPGHYRVSVRAAEDGRYAIHVAYATDSAIGVTTGSSYRIYCDRVSSEQAPALLAVTEQAVTQGEAVMGPKLVCK